MMLAIIEADPENKNIVGLTTSIGLLQYGPLFTYSLPLVLTGARWVDNDGTYVPAYFAGENLGDDALPTWQLARDMYTEGSIDPDIALIEGAQALNKFLNGQAAAYIGNAGGIAGKSATSIYNEWEKMYGYPMEDAVKVLDLMPGVNGETYYCAFGFAWSEMMFSAKVDDAKMERILMIYDYLLSEEGMLLAKYGIEGESYTLQDGVIEVMDGVTLEEKYPSTTLFKNMVSWIPILPDEYVVPSDYVEWYEEEVRPDLIAQAEACVLPEYVLECEEAATALEANFSYNALDDLTLIMTGTEPVEDMWDEIIENYKKDGLEEYIETINAAVKESK